MSVIKLDRVVFVETIVEVAAAVRNINEVVLAKQVCLSLYRTKAYWETSRWPVPGNP